MKSYLTDQEMVKAIKDRQLFGAEALYDQYACIVYKIICCKASDQTTAEKIFKETFLEVWNTINNYQPKSGRLLLWIAGIAHSLAKGSLKLAMKPEIIKLP